MGEFNSGRWAILLSLYFILMFIVVFGFSESMSDVNVSSGAKSVFYSGSDTNISGLSDFNSSQTIYSSGSSWGSFFSAISFMTGISSDDYEFGLPATWAWMFRLFMFYIPFLMLLTSIYFAIPFIH